MLAIPFWRWLSKQDDAKRIEALMAHGAASLVLGLALFFIYGLAGILPILKIGSTLG